MNIERTDVEVLAIYNAWAKEQKTPQGMKNPYFQVDKNVLQLFSPQQHKMWKQAKQTSHKTDVARRVWEILRQNIRKFRPTIDQKEARQLISKLKYKPLSSKERSMTTRSLVVSERLCSLDWLVTHARNNGFLISNEHLKWYENEGLMVPLVVDSDGKLYSVWQLHTLIDIEEWKQKTLEYPNRSRMAAPVLWQEFLLLNKETIQISSGEWSQVAELLMDVRDLVQNLIDYAAREIWSAHGNGPIKSKLMNDHLDYYAAIVGEYYADKISQRHGNLSDERLYGWVNSLATQAFHLNPLLRKAHELPAMLVISQKHQGQMDLLGGRSGVRNPVKLANWYLKAAQYLSYYLECRSGEKVLHPPIIPILSMHYETVNVSYCSICNKPFEKTRRGGRVQKLCGSQECKRENDRLGAAQRRKKQKR